LLAACCADAGFDNTQSKLVGSFEKAAHDGDKEMLKFGLVMATGVLPTQ
jgi:hypothetical protein